MTLSLPLNIRRLKVDKFGKTEGYKIAFGFSILLGLIKITL